MPTIADFSDSPKYSIKTVCNQTGIRAVTLRAWERRHEVLSPFRSDNRYRLYSDRDIAILRWIKHRVDSGISISRAVQELRNLENKGIFPEAVPSLTIPVEQKSTPSHTPAELARMLHDALVKHNESLAGEIFHEMHASYDILTVITQIILPCLVAIGEDWYNGKIRITTEHFASAYIRGRLLTVFQSYPTRRAASYVMVGCAPTEQHEIGALMVAVLLRHKGMRVEFLGPDIPIEDMVDYASDEKPRLIILTASMEPAALEMASAQSQLGKLMNAPLFAYGGAAFVHKPSLRSKIPGIYLGDTLEEAMENTSKLFEKAPQTARK